MEMFATTSAAHRRTSDCIIVGVYVNGKPGFGAADVDAASHGLIGKLVKQGDISGRPGTSHMLTSVDGVRAKRVLVIGLGKVSEFNIAAFRRAVTTAATQVKGSKISNLVSYLGLEPVADTSPYYLARYTLESIGNVLYTFSQTKSGRRPKAPALKKVGIAAASRGDASKAERGASHGFAISNGMSLAKDLGNLPPNVCTPAYLAKTAQQLGRQHKNLSTRVLNEPEIKKLGMHSFLSVTAGTTLPAKLILAVGGSIECDANRTNENAIGDRETSTGRTDRTRQHFSGSHRRNSVARR